jgi:AraC-like DNA-binding protein
MTINSDLSVLNLLSLGDRFVFGEHTYVDGSRYGPVHGPQLEIFQLRSGGVSVRHDDQTAELTAPVLALVVTRHRVEYRYKPDEPAEVAWCQSVQPNLSEIAMGVFGATQLSLPPSAESEGLMRMGCQLSGVDLPTAAGFAQTLALALIQEFLHRAGSLTQTQQIPKRVVAVKEFIDGHFSRDCTMPMFADVAGMSQQHLNRLFMANYGTRPVNYLWQQRARNGAFLLQHTGLRIGEIAYSSGYKTPNHFCRHIKQVFGFSPTEIRNQKWLSHFSASHDASA